MRRTPNQVKLRDRVFLPYLAMLHAEAHRRALEQLPALVVAHMGVGLHEAFVASMGRMGGKVTQVAGHTDVWRATFGGSNLWFTLVTGQEMHSGEGVNGAETYVGSGALRMLLQGQCTCPLAHPRRPCCRLAKGFQCALYSHDQLSTPQRKRERRAAVQHAMSSLGDKAAYEERSPGARRSAQQAVFSRAVSVAERDRVTAGVKCGRRASGAIALDLVESSGVDLKVCGGGAVRGARAWAHRAWLRSAMAV